MKTIIHKILIKSLLLASMSILLCVNTVDAKEDVIQNAKNSIVEIYSGFTGENGKFYKLKNASGFVVSNYDSQAYIVTTFDVIQNSEKKIKSYCKKQGISYQNSNIQKTIQVVVKGDVKVEAQVKAESKKENYAILQVDSGISEKLPLKLGSKQSIATGDTVYTLGFDDDAEKGNGYMEFSASDVRIAEGKVQDSGSKQKGFFYIQHSSKISEGNHGGPLLNQSGYVIGINDRKKNDENSNVYYSLPIDEIRKVLDNYDIAYDSKDKEITVNSYQKLLDECKGEINSRSYTTKSKQDLIEAVQNAYVIDETKAVDIKAIEQSMTNLIAAQEKLDLKLTPIRKIIYLLAVISIILAIWLIRLIVWRIREKPEENYEEKEYDKTEISTDKTVILPAGDMDKTVILETVEVNQTHHPFPEAKLIHLDTGKEKLVDRREWNIGKDPDFNQYVIENNPAISRKHATIIWEKNQYYIFDLGSANGTYVNGVQVMEGAKVELKHGCLIALADVKFEFVIQHYN